jgi:predicted short-subunit dehydrogenase-like oxidoreductase (DUF2520 family)
MGLRCVLIGAGNLAFHLGGELCRNGIPIVQVYSRTVESAKKLAEKFNSQSTNIPEMISSDADIYIVALKDSVVEKILQRVIVGNKLIVHCSGSLPMDVLKPYSENYGVLYPLQTFSKKREIDFAETPVFIEANLDLNLATIKGIAEKLSKDVRNANSEQRLYLHIAAVFACNFVNHLYAIACSILEEKGIDFEVLRPLIMETAEKIKDLPPKEAQTGPAVRFDKAIIEKHIKYLSDKPDLSDLYKTISKSIFEFHKKSGNGFT